MEIKNYFAQDAQGNIMPSANCYLYLPGTTTLATGLVDGSGTPISNPFLASSVGQVEFGAPNGVYDLRIAQGARDFTIEIQCADLLQALNETASFLGAKSSAPTTRNDGSALQIADRYFNTSDQLEYLYKLTGWVANNLDGQLLATSRGASLLGALMQDGSPGTIQEAIDEGDNSLRQELGAPDGGEHVFLPTGSVAQEIEFQSRARFADTPFSATIRNPKYTVLSPVADGEGIQAFPSACRLAGVDYVFFRSGALHTGNDGKIKVSLVSQATGLPTGEYTILNPAYDVRDPCVATDHRGRAALVGGVMKVVVFHAGTSTGVFVYDYNPATPGGSLTNQVSVPGPFIAIKSDVKKFADGSFGFVTYSAANTCYWVKTSNFTDFTYELIGPGNECAVAEQSDGTPVVIARDSDNAKDRMSVYKRSALGVWSVSFKIPYSLHAPTIKMLSKVRASDVAYNAGWMLLGRDLKGVGTQGEGDVGNVRLTALFSRDENGKVINSFDMIQDVMGQPRVASTEIAYGDAFYSAAITSENSSEVIIYTYGPIGRSDQQINTTYNYKIMRLAAAFKGGQGLLIQDNRRLSPNLLANGDFNSSRFWTVPAGTSIASGLLTVETTNSGYVEQKIALVQGRQYTPIVRAKRLLGDGNAQNIGFTLAVRDPANTQVSAVVQSGTLLALGDDFCIISGQPFRAATSGLYTLRISSALTDPGTQTQIDWVYLGDCTEITEFVDVERSRSVSTGTASMAEKGGSVVGPAGIYTVSQFAWASTFGVPIDGNRPLPFLTTAEAQNSLRVISAIDASGRPLMVRSLTVDANYAFSLNAELFPSNAAAAPIVSPVSVVLELSYDRI